MNDSLPFILFMAVFFLISGLGIVFAITQRRRLNEAFQTLALRTGMQVEEGSLLRRPRLTGKYQGRAAQVYTYTVSSGKNSKTYTAVTMQIANPNRYTLLLRREHALDGLGKKLGMKDLTVGDDEFDRTFVVKSEPEILAPEMIRLYGNLRDGLMRIPRIHIDLKDATLRHHERGYQTNPDTLTTILDVLAGIAKAVEESGGVKETADPFDAPGEFASDVALDPALADDPFYRKTSEPEDAYPYDPVPSASSGGQATLVILIVGILAVMMLAIAVIAIFMINS